MHSSAKGRWLGELRSRGAQVRQDFAIIDDFSGDLPAGLTQSTLIGGTTFEWRQQVAWGDRVVWGDWSNRLMDQSREVGPGTRLVSIYPARGLGPGL